MKKIIVILCLLYGIQIFVAKNDGNKLVIKLEEREKVHVAKKLIEKINKEKELTGKSCKQILTEQLQNYGKKYPDAQVGQEEDIVEANAFAILVQEEFKKNVNLL